MNKQHGFLFTAPMVRAIMANPMRKTCTRRVVSPYNSLIDGSGKDIRRLWPYLDWKRAEPGDGCFTIGMVKITPRVQPGHWIYVKETWRPVMGMWRCYIEYKADGGAMAIADRDLFDSLKKVALRFPDAKKEVHSEAWHSSIHMPKWASRAWLPVTKAGAGFVQSISEEDVWAEGVDLERFKTEAFVPYGPAAAARAEFARLWTSIHGETGPKSWNADPPVWAYHWEERREKP